MSIAMVGLHIIAVTLIAALVVTVVWVLCFLVLPAYRAHRDYLSQGVPCAPFIPISGHLLRLGEYHKREEPLQYYFDYVQRYGLVYGVSFGPMERLTVNDPRYLADVLSATAAKRFSKPAFARIILGGILGNHNVLMTEREEHAKHRRMIAPAFHHGSLRDMVDLMIRETDAHIARWTDPAAASNEVDVSKLLSELTLSIIAACAFGAGFKQYPDAPAILFHGLDEGLKITQRRLLTLVEVIPGLRSLPAFGKPQRDRSRARMRVLVDRVVKDRREGKTTSLTHGKHDLLDLLLHAKDPETGAVFTDVEGHETTSNLMAWTLSVLLRRPELWQDCLHEVLSVCGEEPPTHEQLSQLPVIDAVLHETLRYFAPVPMIARDVHEPVSIGASTERPVHLAAGAHVQIHLCVLHRLREYWGDDADEFDHRRWLKEKRPYSHPYAFLPFNTGPRGCIGSTFALTEARVMLVLLMQRTRMELVAGQKVDKLGWPIVQPAVTLRPKYGVLVRIKQRKAGEGESKAVATYHQY